MLPRRWAHDVGGRRCIYFENSATFNLRTQCEGRESGNFPSERDPLEWLEKAKRFSSNGLSIKLSLRLHQPDLSRNLSDHRARPHQQRPVAISARVQPPHRREQLMPLSFITFPLEKIPNNWKTFYSLRDFLCAVCQAKLGCCSPQSTVTIVLFCCASLPTSIYWIYVQNRTSRGSINKTLVPSGREKSISLPLSVAGNERRSGSAYVCCTIYYQLVGCRCLIDLNTPRNIHYMAFYCYSDYGDGGDYLLSRRGLRVI